MISKLSGVRKFVDRVAPEKKWQRLDRFQREVLFTQTFPLFRGKIVGVESQLSSEDPSQWQVKVVRGIPSWDDRTGASRDDHDDPTFKLRVKERSITEPALVGLNSAEVIGRANYVDDIVRKLVGGAAIAATLTMLAGNRN